MTPKLNALLAYLPDSEFEAMASRMQLVSLCKGQTLFRVGDIPLHVYYPVGAVVSMMSDLPDGYCVETHMMGKACMVGVAATHGPSFYRATVRSSGLSWRMLLSDLKSLSVQCPAYTAGSQRAMRQIVMQMSQSLVCSKRHTVEQQLIRWMLITLDRTLEPIIPVTHQELSEILGFRREAITLTFCKLARQGCIRTSRGQIEVLDRAALENVSCECYWLGQGAARPACRELRVLT